MTMVDGDGVITITIVEGIAAAAGDGGDRVQSLVET
jgi:hypothetical protein